MYWWPHDGLVGSWQKNVCDGRWWRRRYGADGQLRTLTRPGSKGWKDRLWFSEILRSSELWNWSSFSSSESQIQTTSRLQEPNVENQNLQNSHSQFWRLHSFRFRIPVNVKNSEARNRESDDVIKTRAVWWLQNLNVVQIQMTSRLQEANDGNLESKRLTSSNLLNTSMLSNPLPHYVFKNLKIGKRSWKVQVWCNQTFRIS